MSAELFGAEQATDFAAGAPDGFNRLWVPHRMAYVAGDPAYKDERNCPFCVAPGRDDADALIVARGVTSFVLLNLFPYNGGHLLVCPYRHISTYDLASEAEVLEIAQLTQKAMRVLTVVSGCHGFNIGMNQGEVAGAGIAAHLHQHIVPRWRGDANFLPIIGRTKTLPELLATTREKIAAAWQETV